jgi:amino acid adenylation domain-containing protein
VEFLDRIDQQVKIRGFRIELEEIEHQLLKHDRVKEAVVLARGAERGREKDEGDKYLCAYVVPVVGKNVAKSSLMFEELRGYLLRTLPDYMIPSYFIRLERMPLTANGKVDRKALPVPGIILPEEFVAPRSRMESQLAGIWSEVLHIDKELIGVNTGFFELGGHSLRATLMTAKIHKIFAVRMTLGEVFRFPTIGGLSEYIKRASAEKYQAVESVEEKEYYLLSSAQKRLYMLARMELAGTRYNMPMVWALAGEPDRSRLEGAFRELISRHESFRTSFLVVAEEPVQRIRDNVEFEIEYFTPCAAIPDFVRPFDLSRAPLMRVGLIRTRSGESLLIVDMHHIMSDGISFEIFKKELTALYGLEELSPLSIQYRDYAEWQEKIEHGARGRMKSLENYWIRKFEGEIPVLSLPTDYRRPVLQGFAGKTVHFGLGRQETQELKALTGRENVTLFMIILAIYNILLTKISGQEDIVVGTPVAGRWHIELENVIGMFVNTLAMRNFPAAQKTFREFLEDVKVETLDSLENRQYQFEVLVDKVAVNRDTSRHPLFDVVFAMQNIDTQETRTPDLVLNPYPFDPKTSKFDMTLFAEEKERDRLTFSLEYCTGLFKEETIAGFIDYFKRIVRTVTREPGRQISGIEIISEKEKDRILHRFNATAGTYPKNKTVYELFEEQVEKRPDGAALVGQGAGRRAQIVGARHAVPLNVIHLTYRELNQKSNQLARLLREKGVQADSIVGIMVDRSLIMIIGILGILKAGGAYLPIDAEYPGERITYMVEDGCSGVLLTQTQYISQITYSRSEVIDLENDALYRGGIDTGNFASTAKAGHLAYVIYTSGTTGKPKGVMVEHHNVARLVRNTNYLDFNKAHRMLQTGALEFDASTLEIWGAILNGSILYLVNKDIVLDAAKLKEVTQKFLITTMWMTSPLFNQVVEADIEIFGGLKHVLVGGDVLNPGVIGRVKNRLPHLNIINGYGPTENTTFSTTFLIEREYGENIPIGVPISNSTAYIVDGHMHLLPPGIPGELSVGGEGVSRGYLNNPEHTVGKFAADPFLPGGRLYKTGDFARWLPDGNIEFLGRIDHQVKVRGFRVELEEIESQLLNYNVIKEAVVLAKEAAPRGTHRDSPADKYLCAYIVVEDEPMPTLTLSQLRKYLAVRLPSYMIPTHFILLDRMPLTPNGKVDIKALDSYEKKLSTGVEYAAPASDLEKVIADIWKEVLHLDNVSIYDNFFDVGGNSMYLFKVSYKMQKALNKDIPPVALFQYPTIRSLSEYLIPGKVEVRHVDKDRDYVEALKEGKTRIKKLMGKENEAPVKVEGRFPRTGLEIAVIGMSGRFPGAKNIDEFWENLKNGVESISFCRVEELKAAGVDETLLRNSSFVKSKGGVLEGIEYFDASFFGYVPIEAEIMDPQIRIFHECAWEALEDAGYNPVLYNGAIGLYAGASSGTQWEKLMVLSGKMDELGELAVLNLTNRDFLTTRVSYKLDLSGPSVMMQTACSTSLAAIDMACRGLLTGQCDMVLAGGVEIFDFHKAGYIYQEGMINSADGHCRAFDGRANGTVGGEGIGLVVLKLLEGAEADGDYIHAVVKGVAVNNDGNKKVGYAAPSVEGQAAVIRGAHCMAEVESESITYIETHGTGTSLGDPVEIEALKQAFATREKLFCPIGSVKTNIGHPGAAAGAAGFIKTVLALKHKQIPANLHFETPNPETDFENSPFYVNVRLTEWKNEKYPLRAGVSSFGIGGTNVHIVLEEAPGDDKGEVPVPFPTREYQVIMLSARSVSALQKASANLTGHLQENPGINLADAAYTLQVGRKAFEYRKMLVCANIDEAIAALSSPGSRKIHTFFSRVEERPVIFLFPGVGSQYVNMGRELYREEPVFRKEMDRCFEILTPMLGYDIKRIIYPAESVSFTNINQVDISQLVIFIFEYALARLLIKWGIRPRAVIGYSLGEYTAAVVSGVFSLKDVLELIFTRGQLMRNVPGGAMLSIPIPKKDLLPLLSGEPSLSLAIDNGPSCIVGGPLAAVGAFEKKMKEKRYLCMRLPVSHAAHSHMMGSILEDFEENIRGLTLKNPQIPYISNVTGKWIEAGEAVSPRYWVKHMRETVQFAAGIKELTKIPGALFIEVGPGRDLGSLVRRYLDNRSEQKSVNLVRNPNQNVSDVYYLLNKIGHLWLYGVEIDWSGFYSGEKRHRVPLPTYPFEGRRYWEVVEHAGIGRREKPEPGGEDDFESGFYSRPNLLSPYAAPQNRMEQDIIHIWQKLLGFKDLGVKDDFFELGGDSIKAISAISSIHKKLNIAISLKEFFDKPNVEVLAEYIRDHIAETGYSHIKPVEKKEYYSLSNAQKRVYILQQLDIENTAYNISDVIPLGQDIDVEKLEAAFRRLIRGHESLRTSFHMIREVPVQRVNDSDRMEFKIEYYDFDLPLHSFYSLVTPLPPGFVRPFDLEKAPLLRVGLAKTNKGEYASMLDIHHIISDAVSGDILGRELMAFYCRPQEESGPHPIQYKDFSEWKNSEEQKELMQEQKLYWFEEFFSDMPVLELPTDYPRPLMQSFEGGSVNFVLDESKVRILKEAAKETNTTLFMVILSIYTILLSKLSGQEDILVGIPTTGRGHIDLEHIVGMFVNTLVMRNYPVGEKTFKEFLLEVKDRTLEAFENQGYQFEDLVEDVSVRRNTGRNPIFDAAFNLLNQSDYTFDTLEIGEQDSYEHIKGPSRFDLSLVAVEIGEKLLFNLEYCARLFKEKTIERFIGYFKRIVSEVLKDTDKRILEIEIITEEERNRLLYEFNDTGREYPGDKTLPELFARQVEKNPDGMAVTGIGHAAWGMGDDVGARHAVSSLKDHVSITYNELNKKSNQVAHWLRRKGVQSNRNPIVGLMMERTMEMIVGILAVLKAGGAYLPIDVEYPGDRITYMMEDCDSYLLLTQKKYIDHVKCPVEVIDLENETVYEGDVKNLEPAAGSDNLVYVIYTSGTTGKPKGTLTTHANVIRVVRNTNYIDLTENDRILQLSNYAFDGSVFDIYGALLNGSVLVMMKQEDILSPGVLSNIIKREKISVFFVTTALFNTLVDLDIESFDEVRRVLFGGEKVSVEHSGKAFHHLGKNRVIHVYGPTETTVYATYYTINKVGKDWDTIPIGKPLANTTLYILDKYLNPQPIGIPGEIYIGGDGLARGYLNRPGLTSEKFISNPFAAGKRLYKSGDVAKWNSDGDIEFFGRIDRQVKIRGFRIEMGEIESQLSGCDSIKEAVVVNREDERGDKYLCAYIVGAGLETGMSKENLTNIELKEYLAKKMPDYMIPSHFVWLERIPLTANGKVDRKSLPAPEITVGENYTAPADKIQEGLVKVWSDVLGITTEVIGIDSNFFDLGGHSLRATIMASKLHKELDIKVSLSDVFKWPTIRGLSQYIKEAVQSEYSSVGPSERKEYYTLSPAQKRMYIIQQLDLESISYNLPQVLLLEGKLDVKKLQESFQELVDRHESFRTSFITVNGEPVQEINDNVEFEIEYFGVEHSVESADIIESIVRPFDLSRVPLLRVGLIKIEDEKYILMVDIHHIVMDGVSYAIFAKELMAVYNGEKLPVPRLQYKDYSEWQRWVYEKEKESMEKQEAFWLSEFEGEIPVLRLLTDYARPEKFRFEGSQTGFEIGREETKALRKLIEQEDVTLFMMLLAVYYVLLAKTSGQEDIVVGIPIAGRNHADLQQIVGMFVNTLPLRNYPEEQKTFGEFLKDLKKRALNAFDNQDYQVEDLVDKLAIKREANRNPLFNVIFGLQNPGDQSQGLLEINIPGLRLRPYYGENRSSKVDLILYVFERGESIDCIFEYCTQLFEKETVDMIQEYYMNLLRSVLENIDRRIEDLNYKTEIEKELAEIGDIEIDF